MQKIRLGLCGLGTVGKGVLQVLQRNQKELNARIGRQMYLQHVGSRSEKPELDLESCRVSRNVLDVADDPEVDIIVELIGGSEIARELVLKAIRNGKHVVTANKALIAECGNEIFAEAENNNVSVAFEAAVAGGIPIIKALREGLVSNRVEWLAGIINGTANFILSEMRDKGREFYEVLGEAQALGYAEADPTFDVEGIDAAHKLVILSSIAFGMHLQFDKVFTEGISRIAPEDVTFADELGYRIKHLGMTRKRSGGIEMRVHPVLIPSSRLIANVDGVMNAVLVKGDPVGPTLYYGAGAGAEPTASSVVSDVVDIARRMNGENSVFLPPLGLLGKDLHGYPILSIGEVESAHYLRISVVDKPGVLSRITQIISDLGISIEALIQKESPEGEESVPVILLTNTTQEKNIIAAIDKVEQLEFVQAEVVRIRVESLK